MMLYFRLTSEMKKKAVCKYIEELLENDCKFLVFAHHQVRYTPSERHNTVYSTHRETSIEPSCVFQAMLNALGEMLDKKKIKHIRIDGKVREFL